MAKQGKKPSRQEGRGRDRRTGAGTTRQPPRRLAGEPRADSFFRGPLGTDDRLIELELRRRGQPLDDLIAIADELNGRAFKVEPDLPSLTLTELARATKTARAIALLVRSGYGPQALVLARTVFESMLHIRWAMHSPADADLRVDLHRRLAATVEAEAWEQSGIAKLDSSPNPPLTPEERTQAVGWFGKRGTRSWTGHKTIEDLVKDLVVAETTDGTVSAAGRFISEGFRLMLGWADRMAHTTGISTASMIITSAEDSPVGELAAGPSRHELSQALMLAGSSYAAILDVLLPRLDPTLVSKLTAATSRSWRGWIDIDKLTSMSADDPCICDHPTGAWAQCHGATEEHADTQLEAAARRARRELCGPG